MEMTRASLLDICKQHGLYRTPHINDQLYANFKGFTRIACLEPYTGLKSLFLEGNALESLEGIPPLEHLKCLCAFSQPACARVTRGGARCVHQREQQTEQRRSQREVAVSSF